MRILQFILFFFLALETYPKKNILFIAVDDLKPSLGVYGDSFAKTPHIDYLASLGTTFTNAHVQQAICAPSRVSLLTGLRPDLTEVWDLETQMRDKNPSIITLPQYYRENGFKTVGMGKIFDNRSVDKGLDKSSWSSPFIRVNVDHPIHGNTITGFQSPENKKILSEIRDKAVADGIPNRDMWQYLRSKHKPSTESFDISDEGYFDGAIALKAVSQINELAEGDDPFFLAVGFQKPHLPFVAPKKYWDLYNRESIELASYQKWARGTVKLSYNNNGEMSSYTDIPDSFEENGLINTEKQKELIHGYYACVSYIDAQVGKILDAVKKNNLLENTTIILWGDHGWHLGDHGQWAKHSNFEQATRSPLIIVDSKTKKNNFNSSPTEFIDVFPTLVELSGLKTPDNLQGKSLVPILNGKSKKVKDYAVSQYPRGKAMGYALRDGRYRYVAWYKNRNSIKEQDIIIKELYDYKNDPEETVNIVGIERALAQEFQSSLNNFFDQQTLEKKKFKASQNIQITATENNLNTFSTSVNLLKNPGFEDGINGWNKGKGCPINSVNNNSRSGDSALMFEGTRCSIFQKINGLKPNTTYKVSVFIKSENNEAALLKVRFYGDKDITRRYSKSQYGEVTATFKTGPDNTSARIALLKYAEGAKGKTWFDDLSVTEVGAVSKPQNNKERVTVKLSSKNLLTNSGFEDGIKGWNKGKGCPIYSVKNNARSGDSALMFEGTRCGVFQNVKGLKPNTTYKVTAHIKSENNEPASLKIRFYGDKDITRRYSKSQYGEVTATFKTGPDNTSARIALLKYAEGAEGKTWFDDISVIEIGTQLVSDDKSIRDILFKKNYNNFYFGATISASQLGTDTEKILLDNFNMTVPENAAKQARVRPDPNTWNWKQIDAIIDMAKKNNLLVRLHGPISPQASHWAKNDDRKPEELDKIMTEFLTAQCKRFNGHPNIQWMDVVNETVTRSGDWFGPKIGVTKWENPWTIIGSDIDKNKTPLYISKSFQIAGKYAPDIDLVYNQHGGMEEVMWEKVKETITYLRGKGLRVDGIGWQAHLSNNFNYGEREIKYLSDLIDWSHKNNLDFHVTEIDYKIYGQITDQKRQLQAKTYSDILKVLMSKRDNGLVTFNTWGVVDRVGTHTDKSRFIFDLAGNPKPAYYALKKVLENTNTSDLNITEL
jgi:arylsulfatase A-like enzyme/GH35 family endo-1,4-beta-xylanase